MVGEGCVCEISNYLGDGPVGKMLACKGGELSLTLKPCESRGIAACTCDPRVREKGTGESLGLDVQSAEQDQWPLDKS